MTIENVTPETVSANFYCFIIGEFQMLLPRAGHFYGQT